MAITNYAFMARVDLLTLGYHAKSGLTSKTDISAFVFGANVGEKCAERIRGGERFRRLFGGSCTEAT
jgi:hypothetical protein